MRGRLLSREQVPPALRAAMFELMNRCFTGVEPGPFEADLAAKQWVLLLEGVGGELLGFSTLRLDRDTVGGETATVVYSGDTLVDPRAWGSSVLAQAWIGAVLGLHERHGQGRLYWLLLTSGFRTYRFLPVFWREFYPRFDRPTPPEIQAEINRLAGARFGAGSAAGSDAAAGVVRLAHPHRLRPGLAEVPPSRQRDPHVRFFLDANPGHGEGDELVCWAELSPENLTRAGWRMVRAAGVLP